MPEILLPENKKLQLCEMNLQAASKCAREPRVPFQGSGALSPLTQLPSPSLMVARAYAFRYQRPIEWKVDAWLRRGSITQVQQIPRRHSAIVTVAENTTSLGKITPSPKIVPEIQLTSEYPKETEARLIDAVRKETPIISTFDARRHSETPIYFTPTHRVPFQYTHDHLQTWGHAYFGNVVTADAFVTAVSLRRPSLVIVEQDSHESFRSSDQVTIRARVLPRATERKPFLIQRQFDIRELRDCIPALLPSQDHTRGLATLRRSSRLRRLSLQQIPTLNHRGTVHPRRKIDNDYVAVPIRMYFQRWQRCIWLLTIEFVPDIEYALHYLPVLAALMLSGHIRKSDSIDLPLPNPEVWVDTIAYVYTGKGEVTLPMKENILFLAGRVASED